MPFMPIFVKVTNWQQTKTNITIKIPSYGFISQNIDVFTHEKYIKAHYGQHFFELFLWSMIDTSKSSCVVTNNEIIFELMKWAPENWGKLEADLDKNKKRELRKEIIEETQKKNQELEKQKINKNAELKRVAVREQISIDTKKHDWIKNVKENEKQKALQDLELIDIKPIKSSTETKKSNDVSKYKSSKKKNIKITQPEVEIAIPMPRKSQTLNIKFSEREFPTPTRESMAKEEEEWLSKQAAARRSAGFDKEDLRPEERNPQWLKAKGDQFFKDKNYLGAISAYSEGIKISKDFVDLYVNRAAAHLEVGNMQRTIEDCSKALEIMTPPVAANLEMRAKCIARRGAALCAIGMFDQGICELNSAIFLVQSNSSLRIDIERMKEKFIERRNNTED